MAARYSRLISAVALAMAGAFFAGCDDHVTVDRDPSIPIRKGMTWAWRPEARRTPQAGRVISRDVLPGERPALEAAADTRIVRDRLRIAFEQTLASKGLVQVFDPAQADFLVDYNAGIERRRARVASPAYPPVLVCGYYGCWESWGYWGPPEMVVRTVRYHEGTLVFELTKSDTGRMAFRAISQKIVTRESFTQREINGAVHHLLKDLKPKK